MGEYYAVDAKGDNYSLSVIVEEAMQLENIKEDMRSKVEGLAEGLLTPGEDFWYIKNFPYMKRMNLVIDLAA